MKSKRGKVRRSLALFLALALIFTTFLGDVSVVNAQEVAETEAGADNEPEKHEKSAPEEKPQKKEAPAEKKEEKKAPAEKPQEKEAPAEKPQEKETQAEKPQEKETPAEKPQEKETPEEKPQEKETPEEKPVVEEPKQSEVQNNGSESADVKTDDSKAEAPKDDSSSKDEEKTDKEDDAEEKTEKYTVRFRANNSDAGIITVDGSSVNTASYKKDVEEGKDFKFSVTAKEGFDVESVKANGANAEKNGETGYVVRNVKKDTEIAVQYKSVQKAAQAEVSEKKEVPEVVKKFLDAVDKLAALGDVTEKNAEEANRLGQAAMDAYEAVQDAGLEDYEGVSEALAALMAIADKITGGAETNALISGEQFTVRVVKVVNGQEAGSVWLTSKCLQSTGHSGYNHSTNLRTLANQSGFSGYKGYNWSKYTTVPSTYTSGLCPNNNYASVHYNITGSAPYKANETLFLFFETSKTFILKYDANGGSGAPAQQSATSTESSYNFKISTTQPSRNGYKFLGWSTSSTATSPSYYGGGNIAVTGTTTLYAVWEKQESASYTVYWYNVDGEQIQTPETRDGIVGATVSATSQDKIIAGYTFDEGNAGNIVSAILQGSGTKLLLYFKKDKVEPNKTFTLTKRFEGIDQIPGSFSIHYTVKAGDNSTTGTLNLVNGTVSGKTITWQVPYYYNTGATNEVTLVESGNVMNYTYTASAPLGSVNGNVITFSVGAMASGVDRTVTNTYHSTKKPELEITKTVSPTGKVQAGDTLTYVIEVSNKGDASAANVVVTDNLPKSLTDIAANLDGKAINNYNGSVTIPSLAAGGKAVLTITAKTTEAGEIRNTASVKSDETPNPTPSNEVVTTVDPKEPEIPELSVTKNADKNTVKAGETVKYTILVENKGKTVAENVKVTDILDSNLTFESWSLNGAESKEQPSGGIYTIGAIAAGASAELTIYAKVKDDVAAGTEIHNTAIASGDNTPEGEKPNDTVDITVTEDEKPERVTATWLNGYTDTPIKTETVDKTISDEDLAQLYPESAPTREGYEFAGWGDPVRDEDGNITITAQWKELKLSPELTVTKTVNVHTVKAGETVRYTILVENKGEADAENVEVTDVLDSNLTFASWSLDGKESDAQPSDSVYDIGTVKAGTTVRLTIQAKVNDDVAAGTIIYNTAQATYKDMPDESPKDTVSVKVIEDEKPDQITVTWKDGYTELPVDQKTVNRGISEDELNKLYPEAPTREGYEFTGWDEPVRDVDGNITITAEWKPVSTPEDPTPEDPTPEDPTPEDPTPEDPTPEDPTPEDPTPEDPTPEDPAPIDPTPEDPTPEDPTPTTPTVVPTTPTLRPVVPEITPVTPIVALTTSAPATPIVTPTAQTPVTPVITPEEEEEPEDQQEVRAVADEETPLATTQIKDEEVPLAGNTDRWALINFALMNLAIFESLMLLIGYFVQTKKSSEEKNEKEEEKEEQERKLKKKGIIRLISLPIAVISLIAFFLTENIWLPTKLVDQYTLMMAIIAIFQTVIVALSRKEENVEEEEPEAEMA